ncbi:Zinc/RING finger protein 3 [Chelonia mydas]|uniref:RING-type E3 ubiquitin transferase n=1 Tax=Chelonia mydas TaxID=8469 RepID=M7BYN7_CHEMY|nr:Zinc/RING finger protein 3 [Chelonia mydas]
MASSAHRVWLTPQGQCGMHPLGLCNSNDEEDLYEYGWVGVVKLEQPELEPKPCLTVLGKMPYHGKHGARSAHRCCCEHCKHLSHYPGVYEEPG